VKRPPPGELLDLLAAGEAARHDQRVRPGRPHRRRQHALGRGARDRQLPGLEPERSGHAAAAGGNGPGGQSRSLQRPELRRRLEHGVLVAVDLHQGLARHLAQRQVAFGEELGEQAGLAGQPGGERIDVVVNACTHFPLVVEELAQAVPHPVAFVDGSAGIARRIAHLTAGQEWPEAPIHRAVFTRLGDEERRLAPALARFGIERIEAL